MRFAVNASIGISDIPYRRFFPWSVLGGALWSVYTCALAYRGGNDARRLPARVARDLLTDHVRRVGGGLLRGPSQEKKSKDRGAGNPVEQARRGELSYPRGTLTFEAAEQSGFELIPSM
jgi:hypothetical protein